MRAATVPLWPQFRLRVRSRRAGTATARSLDAAGLPGITPDSGTGRRLVPIRRSRDTARAMSQENVDIPKRPTLRHKVIDGLYAAGGLRAKAPRLVPNSVVRRVLPSVLLRGYEDFNRGSSIPLGNFVEDFELYQAAEVLGTVGTFYGPHRGGRGDSRTARRLRGGAVPSSVHAMDR